MGRFRIPFPPKCHLVPCGHGQLPHTNPDNIPRCRRPAVGPGSGAASPPGLQLTHKTPWRVCGTRTCLKFAETVRISTIWCVKSASVCNSWLPRPGRAPRARRAGGRASFYLIIIIWTARKQPRLGSSPAGPVLPCRSPQNQPRPAGFLNLEICMTHSQFLQGKL